jgi:hypothetical protein
MDLIVFIVYGVLGMRAKRAGSNVFYMIRNNAIQLLAPTK